ncbi:MAG: hypothetical protein JXQ29_01820 [Planctomycetes bacterium]|nr:hypothetical protein [Planctomycetota bacterium]
MRRSRRRMRWLQAAALASLVVLESGCAAGQKTYEDDGPFTAGYRNLAVPGRPGGNDPVNLLVYYPARSAEQNAPLDLAGAPYELVVFGHGFSLTAVLYDSLYRHLATHGYVVAGVATEEGLFAGQLPRFVEDFRAAVAGLRAEAARAGGPFFGALRPGARAAAAGHSFGGAAALVAASGHPDLFGAVVTMAATATSPQNVDVLAATRALAVPVLHLGASRDTIVPPPQNLDVLFEATPPPKRLVEIKGGTHSYFHERWYLDRLVEPAGDISVAEQQRLVRRYWLPFLEWALRKDPTGLDVLLGPTAVADPGLSRQAVLLADPVLFGRGSGCIGTRYDLHPARRPGDGALLALGLLPGSVPTPFGELALNPGALVLLGSVPVGASAYGTLPLGIPNEPVLAGRRVHFQALLAGPESAALTGRWDLLIP